MKIAELFDFYAQDYDADRPKLVPQFHEFYVTLRRQVSFVDGVTTPRILDLGAGTGMVSALLSETFPQAEFTLTDIAEKMLDQARTRFRGSQRHHFRLLDSMELAEENQYDAIVSALSIHHLSHPDKEQLYQKIYRALKPGAIFVNADQVLGPTPELEQQYQAHWLNHIHHSGNTAEKINAALERVKVDRNAPLAQQLNWLQAAGFKHVDCWFKSYRFAVFGGRKA